MSVSPHVAIEKGRPATLGPKAPESNLMDAFD
jgi:hypothetical protein